MDFKGTKGKWEYRYDGFEYCYDIVSDNEFICTTMSGDTKAKADALLISKAPEMLEKLSEIESIVEYKKFSLFDRQVDYHRINQKIKK